MKKIARTFITLMVALALAGFVTTFAAASPQEPGEQGSGQQPQPREQTLSGTLTSVDPDAMTFVVHDASGNQITFHYDDQTQVAGSDETVEGLASQSGTPVTVTYHEEDSARMATKIEINKTTMQ